MPIQFPFRDLTNQYISLSYQDVVQRYDNGATQYFLDGFGFAIASIPSASLGNDIITSDQTASYANTASWATMATLASVADVALLADTASLSVFSEAALSASWSSQSFSSSYAITASYANTCSFFSFINITQSFIASASWASQSFFATSASWASQSLTSVSSSWASASLSASWADTASWALNGGTTLITASVYPITASYAISASNSLYASSIVTAGNNQTSSILILSNTIYNGIFFNYVATGSGNYRAGNAVVLYNTSSTNMSETTTVDLGDSTGLNLSSSISSSWIVVKATNSTGVDYGIKYHYNLL